MIVNSIQRIRPTSKFGSILISIFLMFGAVAATAQIVQPSGAALAELDRRVQAHLDNYNIPGGLVAVVSRGQILHLKTYGMANIELSVPVTDSTVFEIGSISKQFVSAAAMLMKPDSTLPSSSMRYTKYPRI